MVAVAACSSLPAAGTWDSASISPVAFTDNNPSSFTGKSVAVIVDPFDPATVWLGTGYKGLFQSTDCGARWTHVNNGSGGSSIDQSVLWSMVVDPVHRGVIYTVGAYGAQGVWKSTDSGVSWKQLIPSSGRFYKVLPPNNFVGNISMDPANPQHLVAASHGTCSSPFTSGCVGESFDGGSTWPNIQQMPGGWAEDGGVQIVNATTWIWGTGQQQSGLWLTTDNGKHWTQALPGKTGDGNLEFTILPLAHATDGAYYVPGAGGVLRSVDGTSWSLAWSQQNYKTPAVVGLATSSTKIYGAAGTTFYSAPISRYASWSTFPGPASLSSNAFAGFLAYSETYHLLYASTWAGGVYRYVSF